VKRIAVFASVALLMVALAGCASHPNVTTANVAQVPVEAPQPTPDVSAPASKLAWARSETSGAPALTAQARTDIAECAASSPPVRTANGVAGEESMEERGYYVRELASSL
jgi:hypothetical protein